jgi:hypothetical protein
MYINNYGCVVIGMGSRPYFISLCLTMFLFNKSNSVKINCIHGLIESIAFFPLNTLKINY